MRHRNHRGRLSRPHGPRLALLRNLACALILSPNGRIRTTEAKAKALRPFIERLITMARQGTQAQNRLAFANLPKKAAIKHLFDVVAPRANRTGGYTRLIRDGQRQGDGAWMAYLEFVDAPGASAPEKTEEAAAQS